jgi:hypothetical protein
MTKSNTKAQCTGDTQIQKMHHAIRSIIHINELGTLKNLLHYILPVCRHETMGICKSNHFISCNLIHNGLNHKIGYPHCFLLYSVNMFITEVTVNKLSNMHGTMERENVILQLDVLFPCKVCNNTFTVRTIYHQ